MVITKDVLLPYSMGLVKLRSAFFPPLGAKSNLITDASLLGSFPNTTVTEMFLVFLL
jgi:hypothetical protein